MPKPKIKLRHFEEKDAKAYFLAHDKTAKRNFNTVPRNLKEAQKDVKGFIKQYKIPATKRKEEVFVVEFNKKSAGFISLHDLIYGHKAKTASLISPEHRGKGIGTEAHKILIKTDSKGIN